MPGLKEDVVRKENLEAIYDTLRLTARGLPKLHEELRETLKPRRMLCLSETHESLLMWAHYKGAVLELSSIKEGTYESTWAAAKPVRYQADMPRLVDETALIRKLRGQSPLATPQQFEDTVYVKAKPWEYEKEWRVFGGWEDRPEGVEYIPFRPKELTAVYLGCRIARADDDEIKKKMAKKHPHAAVRNAYKSRREFALEFAKPAA